MPKAPSPIIDTTAARRLVVTAARSLVVPKGPILALDPGMRDVGLARLVDGQLAGAWWVRHRAQPTSCPRCEVPCNHASPPLQRSAMVKEALRLAGPLQDYAACIVEWPMVYARQAVPSDDLLDLCGVAAGLCTVAHLMGVACIQVRPGQWKGNTRKDLFQMQILAALQPGERELLPRGGTLRRFRSDPLDAAGLGLWAVSRLGALLCDPAEFTEVVEPVEQRPKKEQSLSGTAPKARS